MAESTLEFLVYGLSGDCVFVGFRLNYAPFAENLELDDL